MDNIDRISTIIDSLVSYCLAAGPCTAAHGLPLLIQERAFLKHLNGDPAAAMVDTVDAIYLLNMLCDADEEAAAWVSYDEAKAALPADLLIELAPMLAAAEAGTYVCTLRDRLEAAERRDIGALVSQSAQ